MSVLADQRHTFPVHLGLDVDVFLSPLVQKHSKISKNNSIPSPCCVYFTVIFTVCSLAAASGQKYDLCSFYVKYVLTLFEAI